MKGGKNREPNNPLFLQITVHNVAQRQVGKKVCRAAKNPTAYLTPSVNARSSGAAPLKQTRRFRQQARECQSSVLSCSIRRCAIRHDCQTEVSTA